MAAKSFIFFIRWHEIDPVESVDSLLLKTIGVVIPPDNVTAEHQCTGDQKPPKTQDPSWPEVEHLKIQVWTSWL